MDELLNQIPLVDATFAHATKEPLSPEEIEEIEEEVKHYPRRQAATIEALKVVQAHDGWVSDGKVIAIAEVLGMHPSEVESVATFYNRIYRRPVAKNVFLVCDSVSCWMMGQPELMVQLQQALNIEPGGTNVKAELTLIPTPCLGACDKAPVALLNDELLVKLTKDKITTLLAQLTETEGETA